MASKIDAIAANPDVWAKTVFILSYDENDGLFDHVPPPTPPAGTPDEFVTLESASEGTPGDGLPVGLGFRVPCLIVSPWTTGGRVIHETFDHTSILRFLEVLTGVEATNISQWRRQTVGDLTRRSSLARASNFPRSCPTQAGRPPWRRTLRRCHYPASPAPARRSLTRTNTPSPRRARFRSSPAGARAASAGARPTHSNPSALMFRASQQAWPGPSVGRGAPSAKKSERELAKCPECTRDRKSRGSEWIDLQGEWDFLFDEQDVGLGEGWWRRFPSEPLKIIVPSRPNRRPRASVTPALIGSFGTAVALAFLNCRQANGWSSTSAPAIMRHPSGATANSSPATRVAIRRLAAS